MICGTDSGYHSNGMCRICNAKIRKKMMLSVKRRAKTNSKQRLDLALFRQEKLAGKLLRRFAHRREGGPKGRRTEPERTNPIYEALAATFR